MEVVIDEALCEEVSIIRAGKKHVVVRVNQVHVVTRVFPLNVTVNCERYLPYKPLMCIRLL